MITFEQARQIAQSNLTDYSVSEWGWENANFFQLEAVPVSGPTLDDGPRVVVNKATGEYSELWGVGDDGLPNWIENPTPCGATNPYL